MPVVRGQHFFCFCLDITRCLNKRQHFCINLSCEAVQPKDTGVRLYLPLTSQDYFLECPEKELGYSLSITCIFLNTPLPPSIHGTAHMGDYKYLTFVLLKEGLFSPHNVGQFIHQHVNVNQKVQSGINRCSRHKRSVTGGVCRHP